MAQLKSGSTIDSNELWHGGNDGSGSGLSADSMAGVDGNAWEKTNNRGDGYSISGSQSGWYTIATNPGDRAGARFVLYDYTSSSHSYCVFYATHHFGRGGGITVLNYSEYSVTSFGGLRIKEGGTYDGAMLQVNITSPYSYFNAAFYLAGDNFHSNGWTTKDWVPDGTNPGGVNNFSALTSTAANIDLTTGGNNGAMHISGNFVSNGFLSKGAGTFDIPHPDPAKQDWRLRHSFVESPTRGDNIYRYQITAETENQLHTIKLPDYFMHLNENSQVFVKPDNCFGTGYGRIEGNNCSVMTNLPGKYNVLIIGTRKDPSAKEYWDKLGVEYSNKDL